MKYFEVPRPAGNGLCSDKNCPCSETVILRGSGYLYISQELVDFRQDCLSYEQLQAKLEAMAKSDPLNNHGSSGFVRFLPPGTTSPIMMCKQGATLRGLDLGVAAADAKYWWKTGLVPLRVTPIATGGMANPENIQSTISQLNESASRERFQGKKVCVVCNSDISTGVIQCANCGSSRFNYISDKIETIPTDSERQSKLPEEKQKKWWQFWKTSKILSAK
ncbi:MAG: hypothetical protein WCI77_07765 [Candidatus Omnitrophota bacterium]